MEPYYIVCWLSIYFVISFSSLLQITLVDHVVRIRCVAPVDPVVRGVSPEITTAYALCKLAPSGLALALYFQLLGRRF